MVYRFQKTHTRVGHPQRVSMEAIEHGQRVLKDTLRNMVSKGGRKPEGEDVRRKERMAQALACNLKQRIYRKLHVGGATWHSRKVIDKKESLRPASFARGKSKAKLNTMKK